MHLLKLVKDTLKNKVVIYIGSRYIVLGLQFLTSLILAAKLGPFYFGIWGAALIVLNYIYYLNFGISDSLNILLVQAFGNKEKEIKYETNALFLTLILFVIVIIVGLVFYCFDIGFVEKYSLQPLIPIIFVAGGLYHINSTLATITRVKNRLLEFSIRQSCIPLLCFVVLFFFTNQKLIVALLLAYVSGEIVTLVFMLLSKVITIAKRPNLQCCAEILQKGFFLFIYNSCFFLIILVLRTVISGYYSVDEFGCFTFSYTIANAFLLLFQAFAMLVFPKVISKLSVDDYDVVKNTLSLLRNNYLTLSYLLIFAGLVFFPVVPLLFPQYADSLDLLVIVALTVVLSSNSFYGNLLMSKNHIKVMAIISLISLLITAGLSYFIVYGLCLPIRFSVSSMTISYFFFSFAMTAYGKKILGDPLNVYAIIMDFMPLRLLIPYVVAIIFFIVGLNKWMLIPLGVFIILNLTEIRIVLSSFWSIIKNPDIINIRSNNE